MRSKAWIAPLLAAALVACAPQQAADDSDPALWVLRDADTTVYLFGTVHVLKPGLSWFDEAVKRAFDASGELVLELVLPPAEEMQALLGELGTAPGAPPLSGQLPPASAEKLRAALPGLGLPEGALDTTEPWLAAITLSALPLRQLGYDDAQGAERVLTAAAQAAGKRVTGLETAREQLGYFDALSPAAQRKLLVDTIDALPEAGERIGTAVKAWSAGDPETLAALINEDVAGSPELAEALLARRNANWAEWIARRMGQPGTVFVAVGAGHLAGKRDVIAELARRGLKVERLRY